MKYFLDTEFIEGTQTVLSIFKTKPTIDLISIGLVCEDGREYYAISKDFNLKEAWNRYDIKRMSSLGGIGDSNNTMKVYWIRENVLVPIFKELAEKEASKTKSPLHIPFNYKNMKYLILKYGKHNSEIAEEIKEFVYKAKDLNEVDPQFYADYCNYDWVVFCWLFGRMIDLPNRFPYYCNDIQQVKLHTYNSIKFGIFHVSYKDWGNRIKQYKSYPVNNNLHHALYDARYDRNLYNFLMKL